eukprot:scaffold5552_cov52-Phaeocystis_antarctica.AAC.5
MLQVALESLEVGTRRTVARGASRRGPVPAGSVSVFRAVHDHIPGSPKIQALVPRAQQLARALECRLLLPLSLPSSLISAHSDPIPRQSPDSGSASATHTTLMKTPSHINTYLCRRVLPDYYLKHLQ